MSSRLLFFGTFLLFVSCISQIDQTLTDFEKQLVVEGGINNLPGPYTVKLNYTGDILGVEDRIRIPLTNALVSIEQENGPLYQLVETSPGVYKSDSSTLRGEVGSRYRLIFTLGEGNTFQSDYTSIPPVPRVVKTATDYQVFTVSNESNPLRSKTVQQHQISITLLNDPEQSSFFKFNADGIQQKLILPNLPIFPPPGCEEFFYGSSKNGLTLNCWQMQGSILKGIKVLSNELYDSNEITTDVFAIPFNDNGDYLTSIYVQVITAQEYNFWNVLNEQNNLQSDLFDPPLEAIIGNIRGVTDENEVVSGYFSTHSIVQENICIDRTNIESQIAFPITIAECYENCITLFPNSTWDVPQEFDSCF